MTNPAEAGKQQRGRVTRLRKLPSPAANSEITTAAIVLAYFAISSNGRPRMSPETLAPPLFAFESRVPIPDWIVVDRERDEFGTQMAPGELA